MDRETKSVLVILAMALGILWLAKPNNRDKSESNSKPKYTEPNAITSGGKKEKESAVIALQAMRDAINSKESNAKLNELKDIILKEDGIKVMINKSTKKLRAMSKDGKVIAEEE